MDSPSTKAVRKETVPNENIDLKKIGPQKNTTIRGGGWWSNPPPHQKGDGGGGLPRPLSIGPARSSIDPALGGGVLWWVFKKQMGGFGHGNNC